jgi:APA family basic amino acid/polyamine antiporter
MKRIQVFKYFKSIDELTKQDDNKLHRTLGPINLTSLGVGSIIGAGIFVITGQAAAQYAGPGIILSFIISGIACAFAALCYAEFASMIPVAGSAYTYAYATMGEFLAWLIGWDLILEYMVAASTVAVGWSSYFTSFLRDFGIVFPTWLTDAPIIHDGNAYHLTGAILNVPAMFIVALMTVVLVVGIKESSFFNNIIVVVKIVVVLLFVGFGLSYIHPENFTPLVPANTGEFGSFGWSGILRGAGVIFFAYIGFDSVSTAAQESKNPQRDMPIAIFGSLGISTLLYIMVSIVLIGMVPYSQLGVADPIAVGLDAATGLKWLAPFIKLGAIAGLSSVVLVSLLGQPRIFYSMAKDGLLPKMFSTVHPKYKTPHKSTMLTGFIATLIAGIFPIGILGELVSIGTLFAFLIVCAGVLALRYQRPELKRPFKTPWVPFVPIMGVLTALIQMFALPGSTWIRLFLWMAAGLAIYWFYGRKHSVERARAKKLEKLEGEIGQITADDLTPEETLA